jgi:hypothetical protein
MFQAATLEVGLKLLADMVWQGFTLPGELINQGGVVCFNELVEEGLLGLMAFVGNIAKAIPALCQHAGPALDANGSKPTSLGQLSEECHVGSVH